MSVIAANAAEPFADSVANSKSDDVDEGVAYPSDSLAAPTADTGLGGEGVGVSPPTDSLPASVAHKSDSVAAPAPVTGLGDEGVRLSYPTDALPASIPNTDTNGVQDTNRDVLTHTTAGDELTRTTSTSWTISSLDSSENSGRETNEEAEIFPVSTPTEEGNPLEREKRHRI